ncbi:hypothetical protein [Saccharothrix sp. S26]|nr:hypothetical protein [Saccharothrix sp. S26]
MAPDRAGPGDGRPAGRQVGAWAGQVEAGQVEAGQVEAGLA